MKCHLGHGDFPCRFCARSRGFARFAARVPRALDRAQNRRQLPELRDVGAVGTRAPGEGLSANGGMFRHGAANCGTGFSSEPERARLKDVRTRPSNALSAHHYFGALCRKMWCTVFGYSLVFVGLSWCTAEFTHWRTRLVGEPPRTEERGARAGRCRRGQAGAMRPRRARSNTWRPTAPNVLPAQRF